MEKLDPRQTNTTALAFLGDAVYEVFIRKHVMEGGQQHADRLHREAVRYVRAAGQARALKALMEAEALTEEELRLVKRARNHKTGTKARSADAVTYKLATAFEALIGFLYLDGRAQRLAEIIERAIKEIES